MVFLTLYYTYHLLILTPEDEERVRTIVVRLLGTVVWTLNYTEG